MKYFPNTPIGRFRLVAFVEGLSYLFLLFIAMPLKYWLNMPEFVTYTGWIHGVFFILYILTLISAQSSGGWSFGRTFFAFMASLIPFATFVLDRILYKEEKMKLRATDTAPQALA